MKHRNLDTDHPSRITFEQDRRAWLLAGRLPTHLLAGLTGALLLLVGLGAPVAHSLLVGTVWFSGPLSLDGRLLVGFAAVASVVLLVKGRRGTFIHGVLVAALLVGEWIEVAPLMSLGRPGWAWGPLVLGDALLLLAGWLQARSVAT